VVGQGRAAAVAGDQQARAALEAPAQVVTPALEAVELGSQRGQARL
jgi:hypothetical protein